MEKSPDIPYTRVLMSRSQYFVGLSLFLHAFMTCVCVFTCSGIPAYHQKPVEVILQPT